MSKLRREIVKLDRLRDGLTDRATLLDDALTCLRSVDEADILDSVSALHPSETDRIDRERELGRFIIIGHRGTSRKTCGRYYRLDDARAVLATAGFAFNRAVGIWTRAE